MKSVAPVERDDLIGRMVLGRYRIVHRLASGGMGVIYLARSEGAKGFVKPVVIKRILPSLVGDDSMVGMFAREARIMSNLSHPGIVSILDFAEEEGAYLMVLEYVHGFPLGRWNRFIHKTRGLFPVEPAIHVVICVLDALHYAHTLCGSDGEPFRIVHRDISPSNVLVDVEGHVKLTDFGIARMRADRTSMQEKKSFKGTFSYVAPEILRMADPSPRSDLYSCAVLLHELLTGKNEFAAKEVATTAWRVIDHVPTPVNEIRPEVSLGLAEVVQKGLAKAPEDRYADAAEFAQELRRVRASAADDAAMSLAQAASDDFNDPEMATLSGSADLATLDRKWREKRFSLAPPFRSRRSEPVTVPIRAAPAGGAGALDRLAQRKWLLAGAVVGVATTTAMAAILWRRLQPEPPAPGIILVEGSVAAIGVAAQAAPPPAEPSAGEATTGTPTGTTMDPETAAPEPATSAAPGAAPGPRAVSAKSRTDLLTRAFARREPQIARCFSQHANDVSGSPEITVRFEVGTDGHVASAQLQPGALAATPLGACILGVARATDFGPQPEPVSFRIPITARRTR